MTGDWWVDPESDQVTRWWAVIDFPEIKQVTYRHIESHDTHTHTQCWTCQPSGSDTARPQSTVQPRNPVVGPWPSRNTLRIFNAPPPHLTSRNYRQAWSSGQPVINGTGPHRRCARPIAYSNKSPRSCHGSAYPHAPRAPFGLIFPQLLHVLRPSLLYKSAVHLSP
jgi:hypothetical protein